jgi:hypothetical protein
MSRKFRGKIIRPVRRWDFTPLPKVSLQHILDFLTPNKEDPVLTRKDVADHMLSWRTSVSVFARINKACHRATSNAFRTMLMKRCAPSPAPTCTLADPFERAMCQVYSSVWAARLAYTFYSPDIIMFGDVVPDKLIPSIILQFKLFKTRMFGIYREDLIAFLITRSGPLPPFYLQLIP